MGEFSSCYSNEFYRYLVILLYTQETWGTNKGEDFLNPGLEKHHLLREEKRMHANEPNKSKPNHEQMPWNSYSIFQVDIRTTNNIAKGSGSSSWVMNEKRCQWARVEKTKTTEKWVKTFSINKRTIKMLLGFPTTSPNCIKRQSKRMEYIKVNF